MQNNSKYEKIFSKESSIQKKRAMNKIHLLKCVKVIWAFVACLILILSNFITASAEGKFNNQTVKAGIFSFEGYHMKDEEGSLTGYGIEFLNLVSEIFTT